MLRKVFCQHYKVSSKLPLPQPALGAAKWGREAVVRLLLEHKSDANAADEECVSPPGPALTHWQVAPSCGRLSPLRAA